MPSSLPINHVNLIPAEAEPSLLFNWSDTVRKGKGKDKEKAQSAQWFENLPPPCINVCILLLVQIQERLIIQGSGIQSASINNDSGDNSPK